jgi:hypothetical protein
LIAAVVCRPNADLGVSVGWRANDGSASLLDGVTEDAATFVQIARIHPLRQLLLRVDDASRRRLFVRPAPAPRNADYAELVGHGLRRLRFVVAELIAEHVLAVVRVSVASDPLQQHLEVARRG